MRCKSTFPFAGQTSCDRVELLDRETRTRINALDAELADSLAGLFDRTSSESDILKGQKITQIENDRRKSPNASAFTLLLGFAAYLFVVSAPAMMATLVDEQLRANGLAQYGVIMSGVIAYAMIALQFVLAARIKWIEKAFGFPAILRFHKTMAVVVTLLVFSHVGLLVWSRDNWNLVLNPWASWPIQLGRVAVVSLLIILGFSFGRKLIPINNSDWRWFHNALAWTILISGFVHSIAMGSSFESSLFAMIWTGYFAIAILAWMWKWYLRSQKTNA